MLMRASKFIFSAALLCLVSSACNNNSVSKDSARAAAANPDSGKKTPTAEESECNKWDITSSAAYKGLKNMGIDLRLDCARIGQYIGINSGDIRAWRDVEIPGALKEITAYLNEIGWMRIKPKTIVLSTYFSRDSGDGRWVIRPSAGYKTVLSFIEREQDFQSVEIQLFNNQIKLLDMDSLESGTMVYNRRSQKSELLAAAESLKDLKDDLVGKISYLHLPLATASKADFFASQYSSKTRVLTLPYAAPQMFLKYYLNQAVVSQNKLQKLIGDIYIFAPFDISFSNWERNDHKTNPDANRIQRVVNRYADTFNQLATIADELSKTIQAKKIRNIYFSSVVAGNILYNNIYENALTLVVAERNAEGYFLRTLSIMALKNCLKSLVSANYKSIDPVCQAAFE